MFNNDVFDVTIAMIVSFLLGVVCVLVIKNNVFVREHKEQLYVKYNAGIYLLKEVDCLTENKEIPTE